MKNRFMTAVAVVAIVTATGVAHAQTADVAQLKQEAAALKKQNEALELRLNKLEKQQAAQAQAAPAGQPAGPEFLAQAAANPSTLLTGEGPLTWKGITVFGTIDAGLGYASSGLPINGKLYLGDNLVNKYAHSAYFGISPNNMAVSTLGIKGVEDLGFFGLSGVFQASTNINPQSGQLANAPGSIIDNNGLNRNSYSNLGDGSRGGQAFNDQLFVGLSSATYGQLTFGRHKSLSNDLVGGYDPTGASSAFSVIGYSGTPVAGLGDTSNGRWDDSFKYRLSFPVNSAVTARFGAMYKFADGNGGTNVGNGFQSAANNNCTGTNLPVTGCAKSTLTGATQYYSTQNDAGQLNFGGTYANFDIDAVLGYFHQAVTSSAPLSAAQLGGISTFTSNASTNLGNIQTNTFGNANANTMSATASDNTGFAIGAKYTWDQFKFYAGWSHVIYHNPANNVGVNAQNDQGGYVLSSVNNYAFPHAKLLDTQWVGVKYAYDPKTDIMLAYYHEGQNGYGWAAGTPGVATNGSAGYSLATCSLPGYLANGATLVTYGGVKTVYTAQQQPRSGTCSGSLNAVSGVIDYHFTKRFDAYAGMMYSAVSGGLAAGYFNAVNFAPTAGVRYTF
jgi:predicted porin